MYALQIVLSDILAFVFTFSNRVVDVLALSYPMFVCGIPRSFSIEFVGRFRWTMPSC